MKRLSDWSQSTNNILFPEFLNWQERFMFTVWCAFFDISDNALGYLAYVYHFHFLRSDDFLILMTFFYFPYFYSRASFLPLLSVISTGTPLYIGISCPCEKFRGGKWIQAQFGSFTRTSFSYRTTPMDRIPPGLFFSSLISADVLSVLMPCCDWLVRWVVKPIGVVAATRS